MQTNDNGKWVSDKYIPIILIATFVASYFATKIGSHFVQSVNDVTFWFNVGTFFAVYAVTNLYFKGEHNGQAPVLNAIISILLYTAISQWIVTWTWIYFTSPNGLNASIFNAISNPLGFIIKTLSLMVAPIFYLFFVAKDDGITKETKDSSKPNEASNWAEDKVDHLIKLILDRYEKFNNDNMDGDLTTGGKFLLYAIFVGVVVLVISIIDWIFSNAFINLFLVSVSFFLFLIFLKSIDED